jgi:mRNA-degrading endonuclease RelE of RelBE toxin-antitoxin system
MHFDEEFQPEEVNSIELGLREFESREINFHSITIIKDSLTEIWQFSEDLPHILPLTIPEPDREPAPDEPILHISPKHEQEWLLGMSKEFLNAIKNIDRKIQGRILQAIGYIVGNPLKPKGDTIKPLKGDKCLWRYRIGDYRLVYHLDSVNRRVVLIAFTSRGAAYS